MSEARKILIQPRVKNVTVIPQRMRPVAQMPLHAGRRRRVAAYARVSTDSEEQQTSYEAQVDYYTRYIHAKEETDNWEFVQVYTDEGISAANTKRRDGFNAMVRDALDGKINLIITKSVSRFARNTVDSLTTVRKLKERGVEVYFEKENIYTLDSKGELLITIMSSLAQEESRSISENVTWGMRKRFADGKVSMPYKRFMGYRKGADGLPEIVEEEAEVVRVIYKRFLEGDTTNMIAKKLNEQGIPSPAEKKKLTGNYNEQGKRTAWYPGTVESILTNEKYKGDALLQKTYCTDFLTKKMKVNEGEVPQYYVQDSHPAIVDADVFDLVQIELARRKSLKGQYSGNGCFASRIVCGDCGHFYGSKVWHSNDPYRKVIWRCNHKYNGQQKCTSPHVSQETLECAFEEVMRRMIAQRKHVIAACRLAVKEVLDADDLNREREMLEEKLLLLNERIRRLVNDNARTEMEQEEYRREYDALSAEYKQAAERIREIDEDLCSREARKKQIELFLRLFEKQEADVEFDSGTFVAMVEKVVLTRMGEAKNIVLRFVLRNGMTYTINTGVQYS